MNRQSRVIKLREPLPCGTSTDGGRTHCGRPALAAFVDPDPDHAGQWVLTPVCASCALAMAGQYHEGPDDEVFS